MAEPVNMTRLNSGITLPPALSGEIFGEAVRQSVVQQVARKINLPGNGVRIPMFNTEATASFVGETAPKPVSRADFVSKDMVARKIAMIEVFSQEFTRDQTVFFNAIKDRAPGALGTAFDRAVLFGEGAPTGGDFDTLKDVASVSLRPSAYKGALTALSTVSAAGGDISGWVLSPQGEVELLSALDTTGRPMFIGNPASDGTIGSLLGRGVRKNRSVGKAANNTIGFAGDWSTAVWGQVEAIQVKTSTEASVTDGAGNRIDLFQTNQVAVLVEVEVGFRLLAPNRFVRITDATA